MGKIKTGNYNKGKWKKPIVREYKPDIYFGHKDFDPEFGDESGGFPGESGPLEDWMEDEFNKGGIVKTKKKKKKKKMKKPRGVGVALRGFGKCT